LGESVARPSLSLTQALGTWLTGWLLGNFLSLIVISATGHGSQPNDAPAWVYSLGAMASWLPMLAVVIFAVRRVGSGSVIDETRYRFRMLDLVGLPIGVLSQLVLVPLIYWPLEKAWPATFSRDQVEQNANDLYHRSHGIWLVAVVVLVVVCAPLIEELVYRGMLQGAAERRMHDAAAVVLIAALFALVHFRPVEYPGLFAFGLVLGICTQRTKRVGMAVLAHVAFNATGLLLVAQR